MGNEQHPAWWHERARHYLELAEEALERCSSGFCLRLLQHATEFYLKGLIRHYSGDHPFIRNPYTLLHIGALYEPGLRKIFPRNTIEEIRLFSYLNPYRFASGDSDDPISPEELLVLTRRVQLLEEAARVVVDADLKELTANPGVLSERPRGDCKRQKAMGSRQ